MSRDDQEEGAAVWSRYSGMSLRLGLDVGLSKGHWTLGVGTFIEPILATPSFKVDDANTIREADAGYAILVNGFLEYRALTPAWLVAGAALGPGAWSFSATLELPEGAVQRCNCGSGVLVPVSLWVGAEQRLQPWVIGAFLSGSAAPQFMTGNRVGNEWYVVHVIGSFGVEL